MAPEKLHQFMSDRSDSWERVPKPRDTMEVKVPSPIGFCCTMYKSVHSFLVMYIYTCIYIARSDILLCFLYNTG